MGLNPTRKLMLHKVRLLRFLKDPWLRPRFGSRVICFHNWVKKRHNKNDFIVEILKKKN